MADIDDRDGEGLSPDETIVREAKKRHRRCRDWESTAREHGLKDTKFAEGDSRNGYQWDEAQKKARDADGRPALTINKVRQGCLQIINDQRQNKSQIRVRPVGDGASFPAAEVFEGVVRHIEYASNAMETYDSAAWHQITGGYGAWRVTTEYADDGSLDQDIFIRRVKDPNTVWLDPDINEFDGSDARFGFVTKDLSRDAFKVEYPDWASKIPDGRGAFTEDDAGWHDSDKVRVAEYFRRVETRDTLHHVPTPPGVALPFPASPSGMVRESDVPKELRDTVKALAKRSRPITSHKVEWYKIAGDQIIERGEWAGRYIPLVRVIGEETVIDGKLDRKGHVRACLDPQRMFNYYASQDVEFVAGQTKTPWLVTAESIEGVETDWASANATTKAYLVYNAYDEEGRETKPPVRIAPPVSHQAAGEGMDRAERQLMAASGQYQSQFGEAENAKSGIAIQTRQRQGDNATYHYIDHMAQAQRFTGRILLDLIPKVYDTPRVIKIMAEDGTQSDVQVEPGAGTPHSQVAPGPNGAPAPVTPDQVKAMQADKALAEKVKTIFDPTVGRYDVEADVGPSYGTKREEAFDALSDIFGKDRDLMKVAGDLYFRNADFPGAADIADRLHRTIDPAVLGAAPDPAVQQAHQQMQALQGQLGKLMQQLHDKGQEQSRADAEEKRKDYEAETARMVAIGKIDPSAMIPVVRQLVSEALGTPIAPLIGQHALADQVFAPTPPAQPGVAGSVTGSPPGGPGQGNSPPPGAPPAGPAPAPSAPPGPQP